MSELSSTGSSSSSSISWTAKDDDCGEFEVARVLAKLGNATVGDTDDGGESAECNNNSYWGSKGKRSSKRAKTESETNPTHRLGLASGLDLGLGLGLGLHSTVPLPFDLNVDQAALYQEECDNSFPNIGVKVEEVCESVEPGPVRCAPHSGGRSRQNLTEAEKEARRIRRILANRESARQTIRRRQAQYEELTQKAANLASENENLKRNKEMVFKEFQSLQITNQNLKEQMSQILGENRGEAKPSSDIIDTHNLLSTNWPVFIYNTPSLANPLPLPSCVQLPSQLNLCQLSHTFLSHEKENSQNAPGLCILPCPWFIPLPNNIIKNGEDDHEALVDAQNVPSPSSIIPRLISRSWASPANEKADAKEARVGISANGGGQKEGSQSDKVLRLSKKKVDASVGAEARKRRRELMKLKTLHCHPFRGGIR